MLIELGCDRDEAAGHAGKDKHWGKGTVGHRVG